MATKHKRKYDSAGKWVSLDDRHHIGREGTGDLSRQWVFRFCDDFISSHSTKRDAEESALKWEMARIARMTGA